MAKINCLAAPAVRLAVALAALPAVATAQLVTGEKAGGAPPAPAVYRMEPWEDPMIVSLNRAPARATAYSFASVAAARSCRRDSSTRWMSLSGAWDFRFAAKPADTPPGFYRARVRGWDAIAVPGSWELQGYDAPIYKAAVYPFRPVVPPYIPQDYNGVGSYQRAFTLPARWRGMSIALHFGGVSSAFKVWLNGRFVGYGEDSCLPSEFDITPYLAEGENVLSVQAIRWGDGAFLEDQDHWRLSGIHREVLLLAEPKVCIGDFRWQATLDRPLGSAVLSIRPEVYNRTGAVLADNDYTVEAQLFDAAGRPVFAQPLARSAASIVEEVYPRLDAPKLGLLEGTVPRPALWSDEAPNLYTLVLTLRDRQGQLCEARSCRVGFRRVEFDKGTGKLLLNGRTTYLYGVNRHDHHPTRGKALRREDIEQDVRQIKQFGFNSIRTSHYPNDPYLYDLCDEYGLLVLDEANLETHGLGGRLAHSAQWLFAHIDRVVRMVERDKNHPCVIIWSLGNESGRGPAFAAMAEWVHDFDITRPVHYEPAQGNHRVEGYIPPSHPDYPKVHYRRTAVPVDQYYVDIVSRFYPALFTVDLLANQPGDNRPILFVEYAHSMGNSTGNLREFWDKFRATRRIIGGHIWDYKDQGLLKRDSAGREFYAYGGDFGERLHNANFCINGIATPDGRPKGAMYECRRVFQGAECTLLDAETVRVRVENRHALKPLSDYEAAIVLLEDGHEVLRRALPPLHLAAGGDTTLRLAPYLPPLKPGREYLLNLSFALLRSEAWAPRGFVVAASQLALTPPAAPAARPQQAAAPAVLREEDSCYAVQQGDSLALRFDRRSGALTSLRWRGKERLCAPLTPHFSRPNTDNDRRGWKPDRKLRMWYQPDLRLEGMEASAEADGRVRVVSRYSVAGGKASVQLRYTTGDGGALRVDYALSVATDTLPNIPRVGLQLGIDSSYRQVAWYGRGEHESYVDRCYGADVGLYALPLPRFAEQYVFPQECGNRTDVRWMLLAAEGGEGLLVVADSLLSMSAWPWTEEAINAARHTNELREAGYTTLNIDLRQMGVGGNDTWSEIAAPLEQYQIPARSYRYAFHLCPTDRPLAPADATRRVRALRGGQQRTIR
jgi:beta-galactosidase